MLYPIAIEPGDTDTAYGVVVPDVLGCYSAGDTLDEAISNAREAIELSLEMLAEDGNIPQKPTDLATLQKREEFQGWAWAVIEIDVEPYMGKSSKINVTLPDLLKKKIDNEVLENNFHYKDRSHFLQIAAINQLLRNPNQSVD